MLAAAGAAALLALFAASEWLTVLSWWHRTPFPADRSDPRATTSAFYVFTLPVLELVRGLGAGARRAWRRSASAALYVFAGELALTPFGLRMAPGVRRHGAVLAAALFVVLALARGSISRGSCVTPSGIIHGASYTDVHARMPAALALTAAALVGAVLSLALRAGPGAVGAGRRGRPLRRRARSAAGSTRRSSSASSSRPTNRRARRRTSCTTSRRRGRAFALDRIEERELTGDAELTRADIERNRETLDNVRLWDHQPLLETFGQIQEIRTYYDFIVGRQRSLRDRRPHAPGDALGARAESGGAAQTAPGSTSGSSSRTATA